MIFHITPWLTGNIGGGLNASIGLLPDDAWVCIRDGDTMFLTPNWGEQIEQIAAQRPTGMDVIGCMTNRLRAPLQLHGGALSNDTDLGNHIAIANQRWEEFGTECRDAQNEPVAGMLLLFSKATWERHPFVERSVYFDRDFCAAARAQGSRVGVALGLYIFHAYRWGQAYPASYVEHLAKARG